MGEYILVKHHMFNTYLMGPGGSEYVTLETAIALAKKGYTVYIDSATLNSKCKLMELIEYYGLNYSEARSIGLGDPGGKPVLTVNTSGDVLSGIGDVLYLHYPSFLDHETYYPGLKGLSSIVGKTYSLINSLVFPLIMRRVKVYIANSRLTASFFEKYYGIRPHIIPTPVNIDDIIEKPLPPRYERKPVVLTVARISPEKHVENTIYVASRLRKLGVKADFIVAGTLSKYNIDYYDHLLELAVKVGVDDLVDFKTNISRRELIELYRESMVYLHPTPREHFGISVVEAMAAGVPTVLPVESGSWIDIAERDRSIALPYKSLSDAASAVKLLLEREELWLELSESSKMRARRMDRHSFHSKLYNTVEPLLAPR